MGTRKKVDLYRFISAALARLNVGALEEVDKSAIVGTKRFSAKDAAPGNMHKLLRNSYEDHSQVWDRSTPGTAAHSIAHRKGLTLKIATNAPVEEGDKLSALQGAKGVVSRVVPDEQMIRDRDGNVIDILINPAALIGRVNPGMAFEALLGKVAHRTGKRYTLPGFSEDDYADFVEHELQANNIPDTEDLLDPMTGKTVPSVMTGRQLFLKLEHVSDDKINARGDGGVDQNDQPSKGGDEGAKRVGGLQLLALVSHGVPDVIKDAHLYRGSSNADMWRKVRLGEPIPQPKSPFIYDKFLGSLKAAGINIRDDGKGRMRMLAMTDKDVDELAPHELQNAETINPRDGAPVKGGLMDFSLHGGPEGKGWSYIKLDEPIPNPLMEEPIRRLLGLTEGQMRGVMAGTETLAGRRGTKAIQAALESLDLGALEELDKAAIVRAERNRRDEAVRRLSCVSGLRKSGLSPADLMITKVPVLPPSCWRR